MMRAAVTMTRALALVIGCALYGCGGVQHEPTEAAARRAIAAALRTALAEACRATLPQIDTYPMARAVWALVCSPDTTPAAGVSLPLPSPPAPTSEVP